MEVAQDKVQREVIQHPEWGEITKITRNNRWTGEPETFYKGSHRISQRDYEASLEEAMFDSVITQVCSVCGGENRTEPDGRLSFCDTCEMLTVQSGVSQLL